MAAGAEVQVRGRRWFLGAAGLTAAVSGASLVSPATAQAAARAEVRRVTKLVAVRWTYDRRTGRTTVTKARRRKVRAKFVGTKVYERNPKGRWVRVPYVWDKKRKALVYSRALHLRLLPGAPGKGAGEPKPTPKPGTAVTKIAAAATAASPYVGTSMAWHLARRATYGPSPALVAEITRLGPNAWLEQQLAPASISDTQCDSALALLARPGTGMLPVGTAVRIVHDALHDGTYRGAAVSGWQQRQLAAKAHIVRALWSRRHLLTVMEDFWGNHFNVPTFADSAEASREHLAMTIRARAFGRFSDLLTAVTLHPAMLSYLGNRDSDKDHPNENLGRELLELHTVGVDSAYGEAGVLSSSRILTGLSVSSDSEEFMYKDWMHWTGPVKVLGFSDPNASMAGLDVAKRYLAYLAHHGDTARHVCRKLATRFVTDQPTDALVERLAGVYVGSGTQIAPVLRALFSSPEFARSAGARTHRPFERLVATVRVLEFGPVLDAPGTKFAGVIGALYSRAGDAGHAPFGWPAPNGYPDVTGAWSSTGATLQSWNNRIGTLQGWWPGKGSFTHSELTRVLPYPVDPWGFPAEYTYRDLVLAVGRRLFGVALPAAHVTAVCTFLGTTPDRKLKSSPTSGAPQAVGWQLGTWIALLLDSPYGLQR